MAKYDKVVVDISIPLYYLLQIAVQGKLGSGELPSLMQRWAQNELRDNGYEEQLINAQNENIEIMKKNLKNVIGEDIVKTINVKIARAIELLDGNI